MKFAPVTTNVNAAPPALAEAGLKDTTLGVGFEGGGGGGFDPPSPPLPPPQEASNVRRTIQAKVNNRLRRFLKAPPKEVRS